MNIRFFNDHISFELKEKRKIAKWLRSVAEEEKKTIANLSYIFVSDDIMIDINNKYLKHDYSTDIITFDYSLDDTVSGEMYISINTVKENAKDYKVNFYNELHRVIVHGLLHLCGHKDETEAEQKEMREKEDKYMKFKI